MQPSAPLHAQVVLTGARKIHHAQVSLIAVFPSSNFSTNDKCPYRSSIMNTDVCV